MSHRAAGSSSLISGAGAPTMQVSQRRVGTNKPTGEPEEEVRRGPGLMICIE